MEKEVKTKEKKEPIKRKYRKKYKLSDFFGCFKGQIFADDAIFNLKLKPDAILH